jgi:hypothetical protein
VYILIQYVPVVVKRAGDSSFDVYHCIERQKNIIRMSPTRNPFPFPT